MLRALLVGSLAFSIAGCSCDGDGTVPLDDGGVPRDVGGVLDASDVGGEADAEADAGGPDAMPPDIQSNGEPPRMVLSCPRGMACNEPNPTLIECNGMNFGEVASDGIPCDLVLQIQNLRRGDLPTQDLVIDRFDFLVTELGVGVPFDGTLAGFQVLELDGISTPINPSNPIVVSLGPGENVATTRVVVRFEGLRTGLFRGERANGTGILVGSNDPDQQPVAIIPVTAIGLPPANEPRLVVTPPDHLQFTQGSPSTENLRLANDGGADLVITCLEITGPNGDPNHPSVDDFSIVGCPAPCVPNLTLCPPSQAGCTTSSILQTIQYNNNDISTTDFVELRICSNDPNQPEYIIVLGASDTPCLPPNGIITVDTVNPTVNIPVILDGALSDPGGGTTIIAYHWEFLFSQPPEPPFSNQGVTTTFTPARSGLYFVGLRVTNDCGATSPALTSEMVNVQ